MKTAVWLLCLVGLSMAVQPESDHEREVHLLSSNSDEEWPLFPLLKQLTPDQIQQLLQALLTTLGPALVPPSAAPPIPVPTSR